MTPTTSLSLPRFLPLRSFMAYAVGEEKIEMRPELAGPSTGADRKAAA